eukprot:gene3559-51183_t
MGDWWEAKFPGSHGEGILLQLTGFPKHICRKIDRLFPLNSPEEQCMALNYA